MASMIPGRFDRVWFGQRSWLSILSDTFPAKQNEEHLDNKVVSKKLGDRRARFKNREALSSRQHDDTRALADGQNRDWTHHDLRRAGATMMHGLTDALPRGRSLHVRDSRRSIFCFRIVLHRKPTFSAELVSSHRLGACLPASA